MPEKKPFRIKIKSKDPSMRLEIDIEAKDPADCVMVAGGLVNLLKINEIEVYVEFPEE